MPARAMPAITAVLKSASVDIPLPRMSFCVCGAEHLSECHAQKYEHEATDKPVDILSIVIARRSGTCLLSVELTLE